MCPPEGPEAPELGLVGSPTGVLWGPLHPVAEVLPIPTMFHRVLVSEYLFKNRD